MDWVSHKPVCNPRLLQPNQDLSSKKEQDIRLKGDRNVLASNLLFRSATLSSEINKNWASLAKLILLSKSLHKPGLLFLFKQSLEVELEYRSNLHCRPMALVNQWLILVSSLWFPCLQPNQIYYKQLNIRQHMIRSNAYMLACESNSSLLGLYESDLILMCNLSLQREDSTDSSPSSRSIKVLIRDISGT